jgi:DNA invertase Pin-like site-specific DNA recombinase
MNSSTLVKAQHVQRKAVIYIRQSTGHQVISNQESRRLQYAMRERAQQLGWPDARIETVENDTGKSGATTEGREAYKRLLSEVALGNVGIVLSYESTRLSRNCSDWYPLLDICALRNCLIADRDGIYDASSANGRLLLGMKGILSEVELHTLRGRLQAGLLNKARRGELALPLPAGLVRQEDGRVVKDPDVQVQHAIDLVFRTFLEKKSARQVMLYFQAHDLKVPRQHTTGEVTWRSPSHNTIQVILKNPAYAGAYTYGRREPVRDGSGRTGRRPRPMEEWIVLLHDRYPKYISWETYLAIQDTMKDHRFDYRGSESRGAPRDGDALLQGIAHCGECGHKLCIRYKEGGQYVCNALKQMYGEPTCQVLPATPIDEMVVSAFFDALAPAELDLYERAMERRATAQSGVDIAHDREIKRLEYDADLARRRYERVDPDNRLVAAELELRWEAALQELGETKVRFEAMKREQDKVVPLKVPGELRQAFESFGRSLPDLWKAEILTYAQRKALLRCLIDKVVLRREPERREIVYMRIVWRGGAFSELEVPIPVYATENLSNYDDMVEQIRILSAKGLTDEEIAEELTRQGFRSPTDPDRVRKSTVRRTRGREIGSRPRGWASGKPRQVPGHLTLMQAAKLLDVTPMWFYWRIKKGIIVAPKKNGTYVFPDTPETRAALMGLKSGQHQKLVAREGQSDE